LEDARANGLLCYCRPGFEPELAAELGERAANAGDAGWARAERNTGYVQFFTSHGHALAQAAALERADLRAAEAAPARRIARPGRQGPHHADHRLRCSNAPRSADLVVEHPDSG
jgi:23S rRNA (cytidine2498-2'-O)-methyltransferase